MKNKKGQLVTFDFSTSIILFIMFTIIIVSVILFSQKLNDSEFYEYELEYLFDNLENNLKYADPAKDLAFISNYRVDESRLENFADEIEDIDPYVVGTITHGGISSHGIGLDESAYDTCLYFMEDGTILEIKPGVKALGKRKDGTLCNDLIPDNPCKGYDHVTSFIKPVLLDRGNIDTNKIIQMNLVVCRI